MAILYVSKSVRTDAQKKGELLDTERIYQEFKNFFTVNPTPVNVDKLWHEYRIWRFNQLEEDFRRFRKYLEERRNNAKRQLDAMPNPFVNAKKNQDYYVEFALPDCIRRHKFENLDKLGLQEESRQESSRCIICGTPEASGEFEITLTCNWHGWRLGEKLLTRNFKITINPDPRELWKNIPSDPALEYAKPDEDAKMISCSGMCLLAASQRGRSHAHTGLPRDDDFGLGCQNGWSILAVADGAGSARFSRKGSAIASATAIRVCEEKLVESGELDNFFARLPPGADIQYMSRIAMEQKVPVKNLAYKILAQAAFDAGKAIRTEATAREREPKLYATTLLLACAKKFAAGWIIISFQIGDGAMAVLGGSGANGTARLLAEPDEGEYGGQTRFVTMQDLFTPDQLMDRLHVDLVPDLECLMLMSDGVSDAIFATLANLRNRDIWWNLWQEIKDRANGSSPRKDMLEWLNFWSQGNHDDRTIAILYKNSRPPVTPANYPAKRINYPGI